MARQIVAFIRHGEYQQPPGVPSAHLPYALTSNGVRQAAEAATGLMSITRRESWNIYPVIDSSLQLRSWQTASILVNELERCGINNLKVNSFENLAERCLGSAANLTVTQIEAIVEADPRYEPLPPGWKSDSHYKIPLQGAESLMQAGKRVMRHITETTENLAKEIQADTLKVFVGHGAAFRHAAVHMGLHTVRQAVALSMYHCQPVYFEYLADNPEDNKWRHIGGEWKIRTKRDSNLD